MKKNLLTLSILLLIIVQAYSQNNLAETKVKLYVKPMKDSVALRWIITDYMLWEKGIKDGYSIIRTDLATKEKRRINDTVLLPMPVMSWIYKHTVIENGEKYLSDSVDEAEETALSMIFPEETGAQITPPTTGNVKFGSNPVATRCFLNNLACLRSAQAARNSALLYYDTKILPGTKYEYYLVLSTDTTKILAKATVNTNDHFIMPHVRISSDKTNRKHTLLSWEKIDSSYTTIATYNVFRSDKSNGEYIKISTKPILSLTNPFIKDSTMVMYDDYSLEKGKTYYYKIIGYDVFGQPTLMSEPYKVTEKAYLKYAPKFNTAINIDLKYNLLNWEINEADKEAVENIIILRADSYEGNYEEISEKLPSSQNNFKDYKYNNISYYKIALIGKANDTIACLPKEVIIRDTIPPKTPIIISAVCDSLGIVTLKWVHGKESDLKQINIFRANHTTDEFSRIVSLFRDTSMKSGEDFDTIYFDTISLRMLDDAVFYKLQAFDNRYNESAFSNIYKVFRYDTIAPNPPIFKDYQNEDGYIDLKWACSSSKDVVTTILYKRFKGDSEWHEFMKFGICDSSGLRSYKDTLILRRKIYEYSLIAIDEAGLQSERSPTYTIQAFDSGKRPEIKNVTFEANKRKHCIKLSWSYNYSGVDKFLLYKKKEDGKFEICKLLKPNEQEYYDFETGADIQYIYMVKAQYTDGAESPFTKEIKVKY